MEYDNNAKYTSSLACTLSERSSNISQAIAGNSTSDSMTQEMLYRSISRLHSSVRSRVGCSDIVRRADKQNEQVPYLELSYHDFLPILSNDLMIVTFSCSRVTTVSSSKSLTSSS